MIEDRYGHLHDQAANGSEVGEFKVERHLDKLADRLAAFAKVEAAEAKERETQAAKAREAKRKASPFFLDSFGTVSVTDGTKSPKRAKPRRAVKPCGVFVYSIGAPGFEPGTPCSQSRCATGLRHAPKMLFRTTDEKPPY